MTRKALILETLTWEDWTGEILRREAQARATLGNPEEETLDVESPVVGSPDMGRLDIENIVESPKMGHLTLKSLVKAHPVVQSFEKNGENATPGFLLSCRPGCL